MTEGGSGHSVNKFVTIQRVQSESLCTLLRIYMIYRLCHVHSGISYQHSSIQLRSSLLRISLLRPCIHEVLFAHTTSIQLSSPLSSVTARFLQYPLVAIMKLPNVI